MMPRLSRRIATAAALTLALALPAGAEVRDADQPRLEAFDAIFGQALRDALESGSREDVSVLTEALSGAPMPGTVGVGDWRCRTIKMGGLLPLVSYQDFDCRISRDEGSETYTLEKLTGSQRTVGTLTARPQDMLYTGVGYVGTQPATTYGDLPEDQVPIEPGQTVPQVGYFEQMSETRARLLLPAPLLESNFDILYLTR